MRARGRIAALVASIAICVAGFGTLGLEFATAPRMLYGPMLQDVGPNSFTVVWWATGGNPTELVLGGEEHPSQIVAAERRDSDGRCKASVGGLQSFSALSYEIVGTSWLGRRHVLGAGKGRLAPNAEASLRFVALGDSGSGDFVQTKLARRIHEANAELIIHTGDLVYSAGEWSDYPAKFFRPYEDILPDVPFYPCIGNHDASTMGGEPLRATFVLPDDGPPGRPAGSHYWFDYGPARFVAVNSCESEEVLAGQVAPWLEAVLASATGTWRFVYLHHPPYTNAKHSPDEKVQRALVPVFERAGVDIVFCGHNHLYERTRAIRDNQIVPDGEGVFYIITGAGGAGLYKERAEAADYVVTSTDDVHSFTQIVLSGAELKLTQIDAEGEVLDEWTYEKLSGR